MILFCNLRTQRCPGNLVRGATTYFDVFSRVVNRKRFVVLRGRSLLPPDSHSHRNRRYRSSKGDASTTNALKHSRDICLRRDRSKINLRPSFRDVCLRCRPLFAIIQIGIIFEARVAAYRTHDERYESVPRCVRRRCTTRLCVWIATRGNFDRKWALTEGGKNNTPSLSSSTDLLAIPAGNIVALVFPLWTDKVFSVVRTGRVGHRARAYC